MTETPGNGESRDELLEELRGLVNRIDPVPDDVTAFARASLGWRRIDAELAELLSDSALDSDALALTRGARVRTVTFRSENLDIDLEIHEADPDVRILGQLAPPATAKIDVQRDDASIAATVEADELGRFRIELAERGRIRLRVARESGPPVETSWLDV